MFSSIDSSGNNPKRKFEEFDDLRFAGDLQGDKKFESKFKFQLASASSGSSFGICFGEDAEK
jgi:hypothetical protein